MLLLDNIITLAVGSIMTEVLDNTIKLDGWIAVTRWMFCFRSFICCLYFYDISSSGALSADASAVADVGDILKSRSQPLWHTFV